MKSKERREDECSEQGLKGDLGGEIENCMDSN